jgi:hypothetical protein
MAIIRLGVATPSANTATQLTAVSNSYLSSVIITNTSTSATPVCKVDVYVVPNGAVTASDYAYIVSNLIIGVGQSFETFRFALNATDTLYVKSSVAGTSFSAQGLLQSEDVGPGDLPLVFKNKTLTGNNNTIYLEKGTTASRPINATVGYVRYNTDSNALEVLTPSGWKTVSAS